MAGHSKWANIKYRKERADSKKGKIFSRIAKELISAVKMGGGDPKANARLRLIIQKARANNMPNENIDRNIKKASSSDQMNYEEIIYELYGYGGVGIIVETLTDNKNRAASDMRTAISKKGGSLAEPGSVIYNFDKKGCLIVQGETINSDDLLQYIIEAGAEDFQEEEKNIFVTTAPTDLYKVKEFLEEKGVTCKDEEIAFFSKHTVECSEEDKQANLALIDWLEQMCDDVDAVYHNMAL